MADFEEYLRASALQTEDIDVFLDPARPCWSRFDRELGYVVGDYEPNDGIDGSWPISTFDANGARHSVIYAGQPCRIHTYGDSMAQCYQVNDHETWQEYLAAHLGEPVRNFGVGGYGVYQAYRRMLLNETKGDAAEYIILEVWGDDHYRNALRCRHAQTYPLWDSDGGRMVHGTFWPNVEMDLDSGLFVERDNPLATPEAVYRMTDPEFMVEALRGDLMLEMCAFCEGNIDGVDGKRLNRLAEMVGGGAIDARAADGRAQVERLRDAYAFATTCYSIDRALDFCAIHEKRLMIALLCTRAIREMVERGSRYDRPVVDFLGSRLVNVFDMSAVHARDFEDYALSLDAYLSRHFNGHYTPAGNHFFAFEIAKPVVTWLSPPPRTYRDCENRTVPETSRRSTFDPAIFRT